MLSKELREAIARVQQADGCCLSLATEYQAAQEELNKSVAALSEALATKVDAPAA